MKTDITHIKETQASCNIENAEQHKELKDMIGNFINSADKKYISQAQFFPVKSIVYGLAATVFLAVLGALLSGVII